MRSWHSANNKCRVFAAAFAQSARFHPVVCAVEERRIVQPIANGKASGKYEVFANGFAGRDPLMRPNDAAYRADGVAQAPDGSLYISESQKGRVWRVFYRK